MLQGINWECVKQKKFKMPHLEDCRLNQADLSQNDDIYEDPFVYMTSMYADNECDSESVSKHILSDIWCVVNRNRVYIWSFYCPCNRSWKLRAVWP
jgi:hypothetical protein